MAQHRYWRFHALAEPKRRQRPIVSSSVPNSQVGGLDWFHAVIHLSIVIPAVGPQPEVEDTLVSILENRPADCEVVVVHSPSYVDLYDLGDEVRFVELSASPKSNADDIQLLAAFNAGFEVCRGSVIHTLLPGITVGPGWCESAIHLFGEDRNIASVSPCVVARGNRRTIQGVAYHAGSGKKIIRNPKSEINAPLLGTGFFQASALRFMHGFETSFGRYADIELGMRLQSANYKTVKCDSRIYFNTKQKFKPVLGYRGGQLRGRLQIQARRIGNSSLRQGFLGLLTEPLNNGLRAGGVGAAIGRFIAYCSSSSAKVIPIKDEEKDSPSKCDRDKRAA